MNKKMSPLGESWEDYRNRNLSEQEILESKLRVALISEIVNARTSKGISQKKLEELTGVKQPVIARLENGNVSSQIDTILKLLLPLGKTLIVAPIKK